EHGEQACGHRAPHGGHFGPRRRRRRGIRARQGQAPFGGFNQSVHQTASARSAAASAALGAGGADGGAVGPPFTTARTGDGRGPGPPGSASLGATLTGPRLAPAVMARSTSARGP